MKNYTRVILFMCVSIISVLTPTSGYGVYWKVGLDSSDNINITSKIECPDSPDTIVTTQYDSYCHPLWTSNYWYEHTREHIIDILTTNNGGIIISLLYQFRLIKYDNYGTEIWSTYRPFPEYNHYAYSADIDSNGDIYLTGTTNHNYKDVTERAALTIVKYNSYGELVWDKEIYEAPHGYNYIYSGNIIAASDNGNIFVTATSYDDPIDGGDVWLTLMFDLDGNEIWNHRTCRGENSDLEIDSDGNALASGSDWDEDSDKIVKYNPEGKLVWERMIRGGADDLAVDAEDNVIVGGDSRGDEEYYRINLVKYDRLGHLLWRKYHKSQLDEYLNHMEIDKADSIIISGRYEADKEEEREGLLFLKYSSGGGLLWEKRLEDSELSLSPASMALDSQGNSFFTIHMKRAEDQSTLGETLTLKLSPSGDIVWAARFDGSNLCDGGEGVHTCDYFGDDDDTAPGDDDDDGCGC